MKTAMQEHFEWLQENQLYFGIPIEAIDNAEDLLEKEKEQIVNAYDRGYKACDLDEALEINKTMFSGERYYEQTYKPETI
jgi:hypothetical protein